MEFWGSRGVFFLLPCLLTFGVWCTEMVFFTELWSCGVVNRSVLQAGVLPALTAHGEGCFFFPGVVELAIDRSCRRGRYQHRRDIWVKYETLDLYEGERTEFTGSIDIYTNGR